MSSSSNPSTQVLAVLESLGVLSNRRPLRLALEPRIVFDAAAVAIVAKADTAAHAANAAPEPTLHADGGASSADHAALANALLSTAAVPSAPSSIVFIDAAVPDPSALMAAMPADAQVVMLSASADGLHQIAEVLSGQSGISAVHILSHGAIGDIRLGNTNIDTASLSAHADDLAVIKGALAPGADILIYGCDVAQGATGDSFIRELATLTEADVAASTDVTGAAALGGNWVLEERTGVIEARTIDAAAWDGLLAPLTISTTAAPTVTGATGTDPITGLQAGGVGFTGLWTNAGNIGGTSIDIKATVMSLSASTVSFVTQGDDLSIVLNGGATATIKWEVFATGTSQTVYAVGSPHFQIADIDGVGGIISTRETVRPQLNGLTGYTLDNPTNLVATVSASGVAVSGTQNQNSEPTSLVAFDWQSVSSWTVEYTLNGASGFANAVFRHDGNGNFTFVSGVTTSLLTLDLDANNSTAAGTAYQRTFTENGAAVPVADSDIAIVQSAVLGTTLGEASIVLTNAKAGDDLTVGTLPAGITASIDKSVSGQITVTLSGSASVASYQTAIAAIQFSNTSEVPNTTDRVISIDVTNTTFGTTSAAAISTIHVTAVNDPPSLRLDGSAAASDIVTGGDFAVTSGSYNALPNWTIGGGPININNGAIIFNADSATQTVTQSGLAGLGVGPGQFGAAQVEVDLVSAFLDNPANSRLEVLVGGVLYGTIDTGTGSTMAVSYSNGAAGAVDGVAGATSMTAATHAWTIDLPAAVAASGSVQVRFVSGLGVADDIYVDKVAVLTYPTGYAATFNENGSPVAIAAATDVVNDVDNANMASATITLTNPQVGDRLLVNGSAAASGTLPGGISYTLSGSTVTLTGSASKASYAAAIQAVQFDNTSETPSATARQITVTVNDGSAVSNTATATISVNATPDPVNDTYTVNGGSVLSVPAATGVLANDTDLGTGPTIANPLSIVTAPAHGVLTSFDTATGAFTYVPTTGFSGSDTFVYRVTDANGDTKDATATISVLNTAPVIDLDGVLPVSNGTLPAMPPDNAWQVALYGGYFGVPGSSNPNPSTENGAAGAPTLHGVGYSAAGSVIFNDTNITVAERPQDSLVAAGFSYVANPTNGDYVPSTGAWTYVMSRTLTQNATITIGAPGQYFDDHAELFVNGTRVDAIIGWYPSLPASEVMTYNAQAGDMIEVRLTNVGGLGGFTVSLNTAEQPNDLNNAVTYTEGDAPVAVALVTKADAADAENNIASLAIAVAGQHDGASEIVHVGGASFALDAASTQTVTIGGSSFSVAYAPGGGFAITRAGGGTMPQADLDLLLRGVTYENTSQSPTSGDRTLTFVATDASGLASTPAIGTIHVVPVNDPPVAVNDEMLAVTSGTPVTLDVRVNDTDVDGGPLHVTRINGQLITAGDPAGVAVSGGVVTLDTSGKLTYTSNPTYTGTPSFTYTIDDGNGGTATATVSGSVFPINLPPVNVVPGTQDVGIASTLIFSTANGNAVQVTDDASATDIIKTTISVDAGTLTLAQTTGLTFLTGDGTSDQTITVTGTKAAINAALDGLIYEKPAGAIPSANLTITTNDLGNPGGFDIPNGSFEIGGPGPGDEWAVGEASVPGWKTTAPDHMIELWGSGFGGVPAYEGTVFAELNANYVAADYNTVTVPKGQPLEFGFAHRGRLGIDTMNVTVVDAGADGVFGTADDATLMNQNYSDGNSAWGHYTVDLGTASGNPVRLIFNSVSSAGGFNSIGNFLDAVHLGSKQLIDTDTVAMTLNQAPVAADDIATINEDTSAILPVRVNDSDPDSDPLTVTAVTQGAHGTVSIDPVSGNPVYTPAANYFGTDSFTYTISDGKGGTSTATVNVTITPVNDTPVLADDHDLMLENTSAVIDVLANDSDIDGNALAVVAINGHAIPVDGTPVPVAHGGVTLDGAGRVVFTPSKDYFGTTTFTYTVSDGNGGTATASVIADVVQVNQAPLAIINRVGSGDVIVIDSAIPNADQLISALPDDIRLIVIPTNVDGVEYLMHALGNFTGVTAMHVLSHGDADHLYLGNSVLDASSIATTYQDLLAAIGTHMTADGDILVYGCNFGQNDAAVTALAAATHADIAASIDDTGSVVLGGNWMLEKHVGDIEADTISVPGWYGLLVPKNTGAWAVAGNTAVDSSTGITTTITFAPVSANAAFNTIGAQTFNTINAFNATSVQGAASLGFTFVWDTVPEGATSAASTDAGSGTVTITFSKPVTDPIINIDRVGGIGGTSTNSSLWTVSTAGATLTKVSGTTSLNVTSTQFSRSVGGTSSGTESSLTNAAGTAAGSIKVNGTYTTITFSLTGTGVEGAGSDGVEIGLTLNVNQAPTVSAVSYATPEDTATVLTGITFADADATTGNVTVTLSVLHGSLDIDTSVAGGVSAAQVTGDNTGTITITAPLSAINATLASAAGLTYTPVLNYNGTDTLTAAINDLGNTGAGGALSAATTSTITVTPVNDPPIANRDVGTTAEDTTLIVPAASGVLANDTDVDNTTRSVTQFTVDGVSNTFAPGQTAVIPNVGTLTINANGSYVFTPAANYNGAVPVATYTISDGAGGLASSTLTLSVTSISDAPAGADKTLTTLEDAPVSLTAADFGFSDPNDAPANALLAVKITTLPSSGTLTLAGVPVTVGQSIPASNLAQLVFTPAANSNGAGLASFTFQVQDDGGTANGGADLDLTPNRITFDVIAVNDRPTLTVPASLSFNEDTSGAVTGIVLADVDAATGAMKATISVPVGSGVLNWTTTGFIGAAGSGTDTLVLTGQLSALNSALAAGKLAFAPAANFTGSVTLTTTINDQGNTGLDPGTSGTATSEESTATTSLVIVPVNDPPAGVDKTVTTLEDTAYTFSTVDFGFSDSNDTPANNLQAVIVATLPTNGTLKLNGVPVTAGQSIPAGSLGQLVFTPFGNANGANHAAFTFQVQDDGGTANGGVNTDPTPNTITINVTPVNDPPVAVADAKMLSEDGPPATGSVISNDTDIDHDPLAVVAAEQGGNAITLSTPFVTAGGGTLTLNADGSYAFDPGTAYNGLAPGETATETVSYTISDGNGGTSTATLVVTVTGVNDAPVVIDPSNPGTPENPNPASDPSTLIPQVATTDGATPAPVNVGAYIADPEGEPLVFTAAGLPPGMSIDPVTGIISGTLPADASQTGPYTVVVTATDPHGATVTVPVTYVVANLAPVAADDATTLSEDGPAASGNLLGNDADTAPDSDPLVVASAEQNGNAFTLGVPFTTAGGGTLTLNADGSYSFDPGVAYNGLAPGETATETVSYTISDGNGGTSTASLVIAITGVNDAPVVIDPSNHGTPENPVPAVDPSTLTPQVATTDGATPAPVNVGAYIADPEGEPLVFTATGLPPGMSIDPATGIISGTLPADASQTGPYTVVVTATDPHGATVTVPVTYVVANLAPVAADDATTLSEDGPAASGNLLGNDADTAPDSDPLVVASAEQNGNAITLGVPFVTAGGGTLTLNADGSYAFDPGVAYNGLAPGETATETVTYTISDGNGGTSTASLVIAITGVNDAPVVIDPSNPGTPENPVRAVDPSTLIPQVATTDGATPAPVNVAQYIADPEGEPLVFTAAGLPPGMSIDPVTGVISGTLPADASQTGPYTVTVTATDPHGATVTVPVTYVVANLAPVAADDATTLSEDGPAASGNLLGNDADTAPDSDPLAVASAEQGGNAITLGTPFTTAGGGVLTLNPDGSYAFDPGTAYNGLAPGETATETVSYTISDGNGGTSTATLVVTVTGVNDAPVVIDHAVNTQEDTPLTGTLPVATDVDGDPLTYAVGGTMPAHGTVTVGPDGSYTYTPAPDSNGTDSFTYTVTDGTVTVEKTVTVTITAVNDAPVAVAPGPQSVAPNTELTIGGLSVSDVDAGTSTETVTLTVQHGTVTLGSTTGLGALSGNGTDSVTFTGTIADINHAIAALVYTPSLGYSGADTLSLIANDNGNTGAGGAKSAVATVAIRVTEVPPTAADDTFTILEEGTAIIPVLSNDTTIAGRALTVTQVNGSAITPGGAAVAVRGGSVALDVTGQLVFTPVHGFVGAPSFSYTVTDGYGGTASATVMGTVLPVSRALASAKPIDLPEHAPMSLLERIDTLRVNGTSHQAISVRGPLLDESQRITKLWQWEQDRRGAADGSFGVETLLSSSLQFGPGLERGLQQGDVFIRTEVLLNHGLVSIILADLSPKAGAHVAEYRVSAVDGRALPAWLEWKASDMLQGKRSPGTERIDLRVEAVLSDGRVVTKDMRIDLSTGEITALEAKRADHRPTLEEQLRRFAYLDDRSVASLGAALELASID